jgi:hypothetical protein
VLHPDGDADGSRPRVESPLTDQQVWADLMWASLAVDFKAEASIGHSVVASAGERVWAKMSAIADSRPSMADWRTLPQTTTDLAKARREKYSNG